MDDRGADDAGADDADADETAAEAAQAEAEAEELTDWERKRRLAEIFGDVLPSTTRDDRDQPRGGTGESASDAWLRRQVPPHHGG